MYPKEVRLTVKNFPLRSHNYAVKAAVAALAAQRQGKFWELHDKLLDNQQSLSDAKVQELAGELGLDKERFNKDIKDPAVQRLIIRDINEGREAGVRGIPTVFINGKRLQNRSIPAFQEMIDAELDKLSK